jgi:nucleotide-binding universal stress UspA family protein
MFKNILVPLDGSALAARALPFAKRVAHAASARLIVVRAYLPVDDALSVRVEYPELSAAERADVDCETARAELQSAVDELRKDGLAVIEPTAVYPYEHLEAIADLDETQVVQAEQYLEKVSAELRSSSAPPISTRIAHGEAAEQICAVARSQHRRHCHGEPRSRWPRTCAAW